MATTSIPSIPVVSGRLIGSILYFISVDHRYLTESYGARAGIIEQRIVEGKINKIIFQYLLMIML